jgi:ABC-type Mn2+/Zn2+ transport system ATPase subunit
MAFDITVPTSAGSSLQVTLTPGQSLFVVGANGTGKSSLMHRVFSAHSYRAHRISAHRQTWFSSNAMNLSPEQKRQTETQMTQSDVTPQARWKDDYSGTRPSIAIFELIDAENVRARQIAAAVDDLNIELARKLATQDAPIKIINELLRLSNIPVEISAHQNGHVLASRRGSQPYSIAELSDGERNALLIAADVLTAPTGTLLVIDEPERHLHRSIISPLLSLLFARRADCSFVISTHDVSLPADNSSARTLLLRGCTYAGNTVQAWDADLVAGNADIDDSIMRDILGSRRRILFVEGQPHSLDAPLYALLFPDVSIVPKESCRDVIQATVGIRNASTLLYVQAFGLIDNDRRAPDDIARLGTQGVFALSDYSVESIYYSPQLQKLVSTRHSAVTGQSHAESLVRASEAALLAIAPHKKRLAERAVERTLRNEVERQLPTRAQIFSGQPIQILIDTAQAVQVELDTINILHEKSDLEGLLRKYPLRETAALAEIARKLGFQGREQYEAAVRKLLMDDQAALQLVRSLFGGLAGALSA